jgi:anti-sigma regulatory factor (Ser/Thr protein kinase)
MQTHVSLERRCLDQEVAIARLMRYAQALRDENADLVAQLALARRPVAVMHGIDRLEATLPVGLVSPAAARDALTRWLRDEVPVQVLEDARLLVTELVTNSVGHTGLTEDASLHMAVQLTEGAVRVEVRDPGTSGTIAPRAPDRELGGGFGLHLVDMLASRWGVNRTAGTRVWFEVDAAGATD